MRKSRNNKRRGNKGNKRIERKRESRKYIKSFFFWFFVYLISISLLSLIFKDTKIYESKIGFYLISGFILVIVSRVVYSAWYKRSIRFNGIIIWGVIYAVLFGLLDYVLSLIPRIVVNQSIDLYLNVALFSAIFTLLLMFVRRMKLRGKSKKRGRNVPILQRAPSQILSGVVLFISGLLVFRFSYQIFVGWFNWTEGIAWSWLMGLILIISGLLTIVAWWRNNISMFTTKHNVKWN